MRFFQRRWWLRRLARLGRGEPRTLSPRLPYAELVWMPHYLITFRVVSPKGPGESDVSVDAYLGAFAIFQMHDQLREGEMEEDAFPPEMPAAQAVADARKRLLQSIMYRRGHRNKPYPEEALALQTFYYPFYVYYYERRRGKLDIKVFDPVRGENPGSKTKNAILRAMVVQRRDRDRSGS